MDHHHHHKQQQQQQQQQDHKDLSASFGCDRWVEDDEQYDHEPVTVACASRHTIQYLLPRRAWTRDPYHHLPPPTSGVWGTETDNKSPLNMIFFSNFELIEKHINSLETED
ncbi:hypothetical protein NU219Hw_g4740t2 [Hortaea werneckii]